MGVYSTVYITKVDALEAIRGLLEKANDEQLSDILFDLIGEKTLNNYKIVEEYHPEDPNWHGLWELSLLQCENDESDENNEID